MARPLKKNTPSTIDRLDPEIREMIGQLRNERGFTIEEIRTALIVAIGEERTPSRSALGRHVRSLHEVSADLVEVGVYAEALAKQAGSKSGSQLLDVNSQLLQANMFKLILAERGGVGVVFSTKEAKEFSEALRNIALTRKTDLETIEKAEKRAADKERLASADRAGKAARSQGLSKETAEAIRNAVLGSEA